ncbi:hypothetical protein JCM15519_27780 [Fundidesulfovibrio butyratiphilus]
MAYRYDLRIDQGASFGLDIECQDENSQPVNLAGYRAAAQIRYRHADDNAAAVFLCTVNAELGVVNLDLNAAQTAALVRSVGVWDCELTAPDGTVSRLAEGKVAVSPEVTRS